MPKKQHLGIEIYEEEPLFLNDFSRTLLEGFYTREGESVSGALARASTAYCYGDYALAQRIYDYVYKNWFMFSSPILSNAPAGKWVEDKSKDGSYYWHRHEFFPEEKLQGLPISCFAFEVPDTAKGQVDLIQEIATLSMSGGGTGAHNSIRGTSKKAPGPIPYMKVVDSAIGYWRQGGTRKGALNYYMDVDHPDILEHIRFRIPGGDAKRRSDNRQQFHNSVNLTDEFIEAVLEDKDFNLRCPHSGRVFETLSARVIWEDIIETRALTGEPCMFKIDLANRLMPETQKKLGLKIRGSNLCQSGSTMLLTQEHGLISIKELAESGETFHILNGEREWAPATAFLTGRKNVVRMTLKNGQYVDVSMDHIIEEREVFGEKNRYHRYIETPAGEMLGKKVKPLLGTGDWLGRDPFNETMATLLGFIQGDGCFHKRSDKGEVSYIEIKAPSEPEVAELVRQASEELGFEYRINSDRVITIPFRYLKDVMDSLEFCYSTLPNRTMPKGVFSLSPRLMKAFVRGVYSANGCAMPKYCRIALTTTCRVFSEELQQVLIALGYPAYVTEAPEQTIEWSNGTYTSLPNFIVAVGSAWAYNKFQAEIGFIHEHKTAVPEVSNPRIVDAVRSSEVESIVDLGEQDVYDFTEPETHWGWANGIKIHNCTEITLPTDELRTFVCCLLSLNLERYDEWKDTNIVQDLIRFLDNVLQFFIDHAPESIKKAKFSAERERALGLGTFGWHSLLQSKGIPFEGGGFGSAVQLTHQIFSQIKSQAVEASKQLAVERGEAPDMVGSGMRNSRLLAIAPNANSADISGTSPSIEPWYRNVFVKDTRAGSFIIKNPHLEKVLEKYGKNTAEVWADINANNGSVQHLDFLTNHEKAVFKTAIEMDQHWLIEMADQRGRYICQAQSLNTFFPAGASREYVNSVHLKFLRSENVLTMYYYRTEREAKVDTVKNIERQALQDWKGDDCVACQG